MSQVLALDCVLDARTTTQSFAGSLFFARTLLLLLIPFFAAALVALVWGLLMLRFRCKHRGDRFVNLDTVIGGNKGSRPDRRASDATLMEDSITGTAIAIKNSTGATAVDAGRSSSSGLQAPPATASVRSVSTDHLVAIFPFYRDRFVVTMIVVLFLAHFTLTKSALKMFSCRELVDGIPGTYLLSDLSVRCDAPLSVGWMLGVGVPGFIVWGLGIPIAAYYVLFVRRNILAKRSVRQSFGFLYAGYKPQHYYWEVVIALRKVFLAVVSVVVAPIGPVAQTVTGVIVVVMAMVIHAAAQPYNMDILNKSEAGVL